MRQLNYKVMLWAFLAVLWAANSGIAQRDDDVETLRKVSRAFSQVAQKATPAVVAVQVETVERVNLDFWGSPFDDEFFERFFGPRFRRPAPQERRRSGQASGFVISADGYVLTNHHVIKNADKIRILMADGKTYDNVKIVGSDEKADVALLKIEDVNNLPYLELGDSDDLYVGEWVIAIGNPFGLTETVTVGVVSAKGRKVSDFGEEMYQDFIQTDAAINPGNSGGPLLNLDGKVVGINTAIISGSGGYMGIGLAVPINMAIQIKEQLLATGRVERGFIGITMQDLTPELAEFFELKSTKGVVIMDVTKNSPAEKAGLKKDDVIIRVNGREISDSRDVRNIIGLTPPGRKVTMTIVRNGKEKNIEITVGSREESELAQTSELGRKLGLTVRTIDADLARQNRLTEGQGVWVESVEPNSPAARAGIQPEMVILSVNRRPVSSVAEFNQALKESEQSKRVVLLVQSGRFSRYVILSLP